MRLRYQRHTVGKFGPGKWPALMIWFADEVTGSEYVAMFNCILTRARSTGKGKKGDPLPPGQFRVATKSAFAMLWRSTDFPARYLRDIHRRVTMLSRITLTGEVSKGDRLHAASLRVWQECGNACGNSVASECGKSIPQTHEPSSLQVDSSTGIYCRSNKVNKVSAVTAITTVVREPIHTCPYCDGEGCKWCDLANQSEEEWLKAYA